MRVLSACPICDSPDHEGVAEYNGLIAHAEMRATEFCRYDYRLCHRCGTTFARRRPTGPEYELLYSRFNEMLGRTGEQGPIQTEGPLTETVEMALAQNPAWWRLLEVPGELSTAMRKEIRLQTAHLAPLVSHCGIEGARVLEIRTKTGFLSSFLTRVLGARDACAMTAFPVQQAVTEQLHGVTSKLGALAEHFAIPFEGPFDIVIVPHVYIHAAHPVAFFSEVKRVLAPKGWVYLCEEPDDTRLFERGKNLFSELKCFHFQQVDEAAYRRALELHGLSVAASGRKEPGRPSAEMWALARLSKKARFQPIAPAELDARRAMYARWRDESILALDADAQQLFGEELRTVRERAVADGYAAAVEGEVRPLRNIHMLYAEGYARQNAASSRPAK
jgi:SAM-dependent methyltransferase